VPVVLQRGPYVLLGRPLGVDVRRVDEGNSGVERGMDDRGRSGRICAARLTEAVRAQADF
jgi:hypothetical protein